jgi:hypothetical protein
MNDADQKPATARSNQTAIVRGAAGAAAGVAVALVILNATGINGFWPGLIAACGGAAFGQLAGSLLFRGSRA